MDDEKKQDKLNEEQKKDLDRSTSSPLESSFEESTTNRFLQENDLFPSGTFVKGNQSVKQTKDFALSGVFYTDFTEHSVTATSSETDLVSFVIPANSLYVGSILRVHLAGSAKTSAATGDFNIRFGVGTIAGSDFLPLNLISPTQQLIPVTVFSVDWYVTILNIGVNGDIGGTVAGVYFLEGIGDEYKVFSDVNSSIFIDFTKKKTFTVTVEPAIAASDRIVSNQFIVEILN